MSRIVLPVMAATMLGNCGIPVRYNPLSADKVSERLSYRVCAVADPFPSELVCCENSPTEFWDCVYVVQLLVAGWVDTGSSTGLQYDHVCAEATLYEPPTCPVEATGSFLDCEDDCQIFFGEQPEGAECDAVGHRMSDCEQGLICAPDRTCHQPCDYSFLAGENDFCGPARGMWFVTCDVGLVCGSDGTCLPGQPLGDVCDATNVCAIGGWCDESGICVADFAGGVACSDHDQCESDLCKDELCFEPESFACGRWAW